MQRHVGTQSWGAKGVHVGMRVFPGRVGVRLSAAKSDMIVIAGGAVETNDSGERPPYGSGYVVGFLMVMLFCRSAPELALRNTVHDHVYCRPAATRTTLCPSSRTSQASPTRGDQLFVSPRDANSTNGGRG